MDFGFNDEQREIKSTARDFLGSRFKPEKVRELAESDSPYDDALWRQICELGWPGIAIAEEHGGLRASASVELVILQEELGYACAPSRCSPTPTPGALIEAAGSDEQRARWLQGSPRARRAAPPRRPRPDPLVGAAEGAACSCLPRATGRGWSSPATRPRAARADRHHPRLLPGLAEGGDRCPATSRRAVDDGAVALAAELVGVAQRALDMAVDYAKEREQFGRPIGAYQAVSHRLAEMLWDVEEARSLTYYAAWTADAEPESLPLAASMAKARASDAANR